MKDRLLAAGLATASRLVGVLPERLASAVFAASANRQYRRQGASVRQLARNLHRVLGVHSTPQRLAEVTAEGVRSYGRYWKETLQLDGWGAQSVKLRRIVDAVEAVQLGAENIDAARDSGRGVILALPHSGNWDIAGLWVCSRYGGLTTVAERLESAAVYARFLAYRQALGMEVLPLTGNDTSVSAVLRARLESGGIVCLLADRDLAGSGVEVNFFGEQTRMPSGPAMLAALTGAALCTVKLHYTPDGWQQRISPPIALTGKRLREKVNAGTQAMADQFAGFIAEHPADWHMMQPLWTADSRPSQPGETP